MGETNKQLRVDNWGVFFLSRLQVFFNKTDYCDLTLQFEGNAQLKVHRLVMNACTEYFQILEQTCEVIDDVLFMPADLQADVILPIVNFMYTGMLEFHTSIYEKLYQTAELMNIPVLLKLLEAQRQPKAAAKTVANKVQGSPTISSLTKKIQSVAKPDKTLPATLPGRKLPVWKRKSAPLPVSIQPTTPTTFTQEVRKSNAIESLSNYDNAPKPTRFEWPEDVTDSFNSIIDTSFDSISYTSKPLLTQEDEIRASTSFDDVRDLPNNNATPVKSKYSSAPMNIDDLKNYVKEQKLRSSMVVEDEEDVDNDLESDPDYTPDNKPVKRKSVQSAMAAKKVRFNEKENKDKVNKTAKVVQAVSKSEIDHSKIISELLKKYPHLVKKNKNIRLKILAKNKNQDTANVQAIKTTSKVKLQVTNTKIPTIVAASQPVLQQKTVKITTAATSSNSEAKAAFPVTQQIKHNEEGPWACEKCATNGEHIEFVLYYLYRKHMTDVHQEKFDGRSCKYCGHKSSKNNLLMYHQYTKHGIAPPPAFNFPRCTQCPYIALNESLLMKHKMNHNKHDLQCIECKFGFNSADALKLHIQITGHVGKPGKTNYDCQYCTKNYPTSANLFSHVKRLHYEEAKRDGMVSIDEKDDFEDDEVVVLSSKAEEDKIKILSNVKIPQQQQNVGVAAQQQSGLNSVAGSIPTNLGLVDIVVLDDNQQYILHSANNQQIVQQNQEFMIPELGENTFVQNQISAAEHNVVQTMLSNSDIASTDELVMVLTDHDYNDGNSEILTNDNSNIVVLYSHPVEGQEQQFITSQGNLMLNAETGILELRSGNGDAIVTQANTVESIEMIQREIESHTAQTAAAAAAAAAAAEAAAATTVTETAVTTSEPETTLAAPIENSIEESEAPSATEQVVEMPPLTPQQIVEDGVQEQQQQQQQEEVKFDDPTVATTDSTTEESTNEVHTFVEPTSDTITTPYENLNAPSVDEVDAETKPEPEPMEVDENSPNEIINNTEDDINTKQVPTTEDVVNETKEPTDVSHAIDDAAAAAVLDAISEQVEEEAEKIETVAEKEEDPVTQQQNEIVPNVKVGDAPVEATVEQTVLEATATLDPEENNKVDLPEEEPMEVDGVRQEAETTDSQVVADVPAEDVTIKNEDDIVTEAKEVIEDDNAQNDSAVVDDIVEAKVAEAESILEKVATNDCDEVEGSDKTKEAAKISILDDWEDTDSQQSEHGKSTTVNKLMNEWDDD